MNNVVSKNFSRSSNTYAAAADFQRFAAGKLYDFIQREMPERRTVERVLELGCGTGFLTIGLLKLFPSAKFVVSDISEEMLQRCKDNTHSVMDQRIHSYFERYDICEAKIDKYYDLVISALAFQWVQNMDMVMANIREHLQPNGHLVFSTLLEGTYSILHQAFEETGEPYPGPRFLTHDGLRQVCSKFNNFRIEIVPFVETYSSVQQFMKRIQLTGTGNPSGRPVPVGVMRRVLQRCEELAAGELKADYQIANVICR